MNQEHQGLQMSTELTRNLKVDSCAWLRIFGLGLDFDGISHNVGVTGIETLRAGEPMPSGRPLPRDLWSIRSPLPRTEPMDAHLKWLRQALLPHYDYLRSLIGKNEVRSFCGVIADVDRYCFRVSADALRIFIELGIDMELSLIFTGYSDLESESPQPEPAETESEAPEAQPGTYRTDSKVSFEVIGASLDLDGITKTLGFRPSQSHRLGELSPSGEGYQSDLWLLTTPLPRDAELDAHFKWLAAALLPHSDYLRSLAAVTDLLIRCKFGTESDTGGVSVSPEALRLPVELGAPIEFSVFLI